MMRKMLGWAKTHKTQCFLLVAGILCTLAAVEYFVNLRFFSSFIDDEFQSALAAKEFMETGTTAYDRAMPVTVLLSGWIRVFGFSEAACRSFSAVLGVITVFSVVFVTARLFHSLCYSFLVGMFFLAEPVLTYYFRFTRMYALAVLVSVWLYYLLYLALTKHPAFFLPCLPLLYLAYQVHLNALIPLLGVACFILIRAMLHRKKSDIILSVVILSLAGFSVVNILAYKATGDFLFDPKGVYRDLLQLSGFSHPLHPEYLSYIIGVTGSVILSLVLLAIVIGTAIKRKKMEEEVLYLLLLCVCTTFFFWILSDHYYVSNYIMMLTPFALMLYLHAYLDVKQLSRKAAVVLLAGLSLFAGFFLTKQIATYAAGENPEDADYRTAYAKIGMFYDTEGETVPIVESLMRTYYLDPIVKEYESAGLNRTEDMEIWFDFAGDHPEGIVTVENLKRPLLTVPAQLVILNWTDRVTGEGIDQSGVSVAHYQFLPLLQEEETGENDRIASVSVKGDEIEIRVNYDLLMSVPYCPGSPQMLFVTLDLTGTEGNVQRKVGLFLPEEMSSQKEGVYRMSVKDLRGADPGEIIQAGIEDHMAIYGSGELIEFP